MHALRTVLTWCRAPRNRWVLVALVVGLALRLVWCTWITEAPSRDTSDPAQYLTMARGFASFDMPILHEEHTAFAPPGYSMVLAPVSIASEKTDWFSLEFGAALVNTAAGTATILGVALLAGWWVGAAARAPAAWLLALAPGQIYVTSTALTETFFAFLLVAVLAAVTWLLRRHDRPPRAGPLLLVGVAVGLAVLVRSPGLLLLAAPALVLRGSTGSWRGALRPTLLLLAGACVLLVPWTARNAAQVGVFSPLSTNNAAFLCTGHSAYADGGYDESEEGLRYCYEGSPWDPEHPDESEWYRRVSVRAAKYAVTHPGHEVELAWWKTWDVVANDSESLVNARDFGNREIASERVTQMLSDLANAWYLGVVALAVAGLVLVPRCRRAWPIWATVAGSLALVYGGISLGRYHHPVMPLVVVLAAGTIGALRERLAERPDDEPGSEDDAEPDEPQAVVGAST
jgi:4-amino-4-deoxy-L-arabinose transferase-like glycosyltransferase